MIRLTWSLKNFLMKYHSELFVPLMFGHIEAYTKEIHVEYMEWVQTDEGREYLKGGSKYKENDYE